MSFTSIGDLAQSLQLRRQSATIKSNLDQYAVELSTGRHADIAKELNGNMRILSGIEASLHNLESFERMTSHAARHLQDTQSALDVIQTASDQAATDLLMATNVQDGALLENLAADAESKLSSVLGALNSRSAGQSIFSGTAIDLNAVVSVSDLMTAIRSDLAGLSTTGDVEAALTDWFESGGGGFETLAFTGSDVALSPLKLNQFQSADLSVTALNPEIRQTLKGLVSAALVAYDVPSDGVQDKKQMITYASETLFSNASGLSALRGFVGLQQAIVETAATTNSSQENALEVGRNDLTSTDPFETATKLENARSQLEMLYSVTARLSQLKLADFLR